MLVLAKECSSSKGQRLLLTASAYESQQILSRATVLSPMGVKAPLMQGRPEVSKLGVDLQAVLEPI